MSKQDRSKENTCMKKAGFTLLELIILIIVAGILTVSVSTRFFSSSDVAAETVIDQIIADIQYTQLLAMGSLDQRYIKFGRYQGQGGGGHGCPHEGGCGGCTAWGGMGGDEIYYYEIEGQEKKYLPASITVDDVTLTFDSLGELTGGSDKTFSAAGRTITVYRITGKVANW